MREAARALDDVSDHLGEVLRHADELLAEWARFGGQVRTQVEREAQAIGSAVDEAVARVANSGVDRAIADRLRALTGEIERLEQRARAASRAVAEQRTADRRVLWAVVAGIVVANALLVVLLLRKPEPVVLPAPQPVKLEAPAAAPEPAIATGGDADSADEARASAAGAGANAAHAAGASAGTAEATDPKAGATPTGSNPVGGEHPAGMKAGGKAGAAGTSATGGNVAGAGGNTAGANPTGGNAAGAGGNAAGANATGTASKAPAKAGDGVGSTRPLASPVVLPPKAGARPHKKLP